MIVVDTSFVYALLDRADRGHTAARTWLEGEGADETLVTTPLAVAEIDHLAGARLTSAARSAFRRQLTSGAVAVEWWREAAADAVAFAEQYADLGLDLTDASLVVLAARLGSPRIATFDERHFRAVRPLDHPAFTLVPLDAEAA